MKRTTPLTKSGFEELQREHATTLEKRKQAVAELTEARDMGDRSENAAYKSARFKLSGIDRRLRYLERVLKQAVIVEKPPDNTIGIGSTVTITNGNEEKTYAIVGEHEADVFQGKLSNLSPLGRALMGKHIDESIRVTTPNGLLQYKILLIQA